MSIYYEVLGCPFCSDMNVSVLFANLTLPFGRKIHFVNIDYGDPTIKEFRFIQGEQGLLPTITIPNFDNQQNLKSKIVLIGSSYIPLNLQLLRELNDVTYVPY